MRTVIAIALAASCLVPVACGGDDDDATTGATETTSPTEGTTTRADDDASQTDLGGTEDSITVRAVSSLPGTIKVVLTSDDPKQACEEFVTDEFVNRAYGGTEGCKAAIDGGGTADSVEVSDVQRDSDTATAVAVPDGGPNSGEDIDVKLVREDGVWKVDDLHSNVPAGP